MMHRTLYNNRSETKSTKNFDRVRYEIGGMVLTQEELTIDEMTRVTELLQPETAQSVQDKDPFAGIRSFNVLNVSIGADKIKQILKIAVKTSSKFDPAKLKSSEAKQMMDDFFFLNPELSRNLATLSNALATVLMTSSLRDLGNTVLSSVPDSRQQSKKSSLLSAKSVPAAMRKRKR